MQRKLNDIFEIKFNFVSCHRIGKSIERLLQLGFEIFQGAVQTRILSFILKLSWLCPALKSVRSGMYIFRPFNSPGHSDAKSRNLAFAAYAKKSRAEVERSYGCGFVNRQNDFLDCFS